MTLISYKLGKLNFSLKCITMSLSNTQSRGTSVNLISFSVTSNADTLSCTDPSFEIEALIRTIRPIIINTVNRLEVRTHSCLKISFRYFLRGLGLFSGFSFGVGPLTELVETSIICRDILLFFLLTGTEISGRDSDRFNFRFGVILDSAIFGEFAAFLC